MNLLRENNPFSSSSIEILNILISNMKFLTVHIFLYFMYIKCKSEKRKCLNFDMHLRNL